jgi:peptidoglycan-associated lipoprotein
MRKWILGAVFVAAIAGCSSKPTQNAPVEDRSLTGTPPSTTGGATSTGVGTGGVSGTPGVGVGGAGNPLRDPNNILSKRSVYFDYDQFTIKDDYKPMIEAHAKYLQANRAARATLQGHTDERGTREYNIALGQKRADSVKKLMVLLGANEVQIETVSFGKEKPRREGHDESSWSENRRVEILHAGE